MRWLKALTTFQKVLVGIVAFATLSCLGGIVGAIASPSSSSNGSLHTSSPLVTEPVHTAPPATSAPTTAGPKTSPTTASTPKATAKPSPTPTAKPTTHKPTPKPTPTKSSGGFIIPGAF